jgi:hypothetical protein
MRQPTPLPSGLETARQRFDLWRRTRQGHGRIPAALWRLAAELAGAYGLCRTARALRLDYPALKRHVQAAGGPSVSRPQRELTFVELVPSAPSAPAGPAGLPECILECENAGGAKLRVQLKGVAAPDLIALSRSFWSAEA